MPSPTITPLLLGCASERLRSTCVGNL